MQPSCLVTIKPHRLCSGDDDDDAVPAAGLGFSHSNFAESHESSPTEADVSSEEEDEEEVTGRETDRWFKLLVMSCTRWVISKLNTISWDYRLVAKQLDRMQLEDKKTERVGLFEWINVNLLRIL